MWLSAKKNFWSLLHAYMKLNEIKHAVGTMFLRKHDMKWHDIACGSSVIVSCTNKWRRVG
jgi:hypothetical protein